MSTLRHIHTDGGRAAAGINERADCTVRAFALAAGCGYELAHAALRSNGRKTGCGFRLCDHAHDVAQSLGIEIKLVRRSGTLRRLLADYPAGRLIVRVTGHAFAVIDGVIMDTREQSLDRRVKSAWRLS